MKNAMIIGSTGMTGRLLVEQLILSDIYQEIHVVHYKKTLHHGKPKVIEHIIEFKEFESLQIDAKIDDFFCTIGTTIKTAGSPEAFKKVDLDYVIKASNWAKKNGVKQFVTISSMGANAESGNLYLKTKGEMENHLQSLEFDKLTIVRPPLLYGEKRPDFRIGEVIGKWFMIPMGWFSDKIKPLKIKNLAIALYNSSQEKYSNSRILNPKELHSKY
jgi:uncharacterized protein YbjT (DUF2867 family)